MALSAVLERTTKLRTDEEEERLARAAEEHNRRSLESYKSLVAESRTPAEQAEPVPAEIPEPESSETLTGSPYAKSAADYRAVPMPAGREQLFGGLEYRDGNLVNTESPAMPELSAATETLSVPDEESEDARPTRRTLETLARPAAESTIEPAAERTRFLDVLSMRAKVALAVVAVAIVIALVLVFVNTSIISGLDASIEASKSELNALTSVSQALRAQIGSMSEEAYIEEYARTVLGMVR